MGKAENRKRAKRLKEAKREREQKALIEAGLGPAGQEITRRSLSHGVELKMNIGKVKYSELIKKLVSPYITSKDDINDLKHKFTVGVCAWNLALLSQVNEEDAKAAKENLIKLASETPEVLPLIDKVMSYKLEIFPDDKSLIADYEIRETRGKHFDFTVTTTRLEAI